MHIETYTFKTQKEVMELHGAVLERGQLDIVSKLTGIPKEKINSWTIEYNNHTNHNPFYETSNVGTNRGHITTLRTLNLDEALSHATPWNENEKGIERILVTSRES